MAEQVEQIRKLREHTGAGMMDCKKALIDANGDFDGAVKLLREKGAAQMEKRAHREAKEGIVEAYIHMGGKLGVLVEINCETDFVALNEGFQQFAHDIAMQIAAANPIYVSRDAVNEELIEKERDIYRTMALNEGKPGDIVEKIVDGRIEKFYNEICLLEQAFVKNPDITIKEYLADVVSKIGENIVIRRFVRFSLGEESA